MLGIYVRNLFLNWTIFIPLICVVLLVPRILLELAKYPAEPRDLIIILMIALIAGTVAVVCTVRKMPSKNIDGGAVEWNTDAGVFLTVIAPLIITALAATTFWAWTNQPKQTTLDQVKYLPPILKHRVIYFVLFSVLIFVLGNLLFFVARTIFYIYEKYKYKVGKRNMRDIAASLFSFAVLLEIASAGFSATVGGLLTWLIANNFFTPEWLNAADHQQLYVCFAVPLYLLSFSTGATVFVGIYSKFASDDDRNKNIKGTLLYIRPSFYEKLESTELRYYARSNATFPHQSTADQLYDEKQFEAYRALGFCIMEEILRKEKESAATWLEPSRKSGENVNQTSTVDAAQTSPGLPNNETDAV